MEVEGYFRQKEHVRGIMGEEHGLSVQGPVVWYSWEEE